MNMMSRTEYLELLNKRCQEHPTKCCYIYKIRSKIKTCNQERKRGHILCEKHFNQSYKNSAAGKHRGICRRLDVRYNMERSVLPPKKRYTHYYCKDVTFEEDPTHVVVHSESFRDAFKFKQTTLHDAMNRPRPSPFSMLSPRSFLPKFTEN